MERDDLIAWATRNRPYLLGKTADEVAYLARMNDFTPLVVYEVLSHWSPKSGLDMRMREAFAIGCEIHHLENLGLLPIRWRDMVAYQQLGKEWGDA